MVKLHIKPENIIIKNMIDGSKYNILMVETMKKLCKKL